MTAVTPIRTSLQQVRGGNQPVQPLPPTVETARPGPPARTDGTRPLRTPTALRRVDEQAEVRAVAHGTVQAAMEVLAGIRPVHQLARRLDPQCLTALQHRACLIRRELVRTGSPAVARLHRNTVVRSIRLCEVTAGVYEASAVVVDDVRTRAVAIRLERSKQAWRVTELIIG